MEQHKPTILILFYSLYGHGLAMARSIADGVVAAGGVPVLRQVAEIIPEEKWDDAIKGAKAAMADIPVADPKRDLRGIDGIIVGGPTRFGNMPAQMQNFWDQTTGEWMEGTLIGKPAAVFTSTATQHGGQESTLLSTMTTLLHHGCVVVGLPYSFPEQMRVDEITGGSPYGASTITGGAGERMPSANELKLAAGLGSHVTGIAAKLAA